MVRSLRFTAAEREEMFRLLDFEVQEAVTARSDYLGHMRQSYNQYRNILPNKSRPWPGASNLSPPLTTRSCEQVIRRTVSHFTQQGEFIYLAPNSAATAEIGRAEKVENFLRWQAINELRYFDEIDAFIRNLVIGGTGFLQTGWISRERWVARSWVQGRSKLVVTERDGRMDPVYRENGERPRRQDPVEKMFKELFGSQGWEVISKESRGEEGSVEMFDVSFRDNRGIERLGEVEIDRDESYGDEIEVTAQYKTLVKDQPFLRNLQIENVLVTPGDHTIQDAPLVGVREWMSVDEVEHNLDTGVWYLEEDEKNDVMARLTTEDEMGNPKARKQPPGRYYHEEDQQKRDDDDYLGLETEHIRTAAIPVVRYTTEWDLRGEGEVQEAQIWVLPRERKVVRVHYDSVDNQSGMRNIVSRRYLPVRGEHYGLSLPQYIRSLQIELNAVHNQDMDAEAIRNNPIIFIDPSSHFDRDNVLYGPGDAVPVHNPRENVMVPTFSARDRNSIDRAQQLIAWGEDMTNIGSLAVGRSENRPNAQRTARGAQLLLGQTAASIEYQAESIAPGVVDTWKQIYAWNLANMSSGKEFRVHGTTEVQSFSGAEEFRGDYDFMFDVGRAIVNDEMRRILWTEFFQLIAPASNARPDQIQRPFYNLIVDMAKKFKVPSPQKYLPPVPEIQPDPLSPEHEHQLFMQGRPVSTHPADNVLEHLEKHALFLEQVMDPESNIVLSDAGLAFAQEHMMDTQRQAAQLQQATQGLGGRMGLGENPAIPSGPGQAPTTQPQVPMDLAAEETFQGGF